MYNSITVDPKRFQERKKIYLHSIAKHIIIFNNNIYDYSFKKPNAGTVGTPSNSNSSNSANLFQEHGM